MIDNMMHSMTHSKTGRTDQLSSIINERLITNNRFTTNERLIPGAHANQGQGDVFFRPAGVSFQIDRHTDRFGRGLSTIEERIQWTI